MNTTHHDSSPDAATHSLLAAIRALRAPEHTGENRCWPCTAVNLALVAVAALWLLVRRRRVSSLLVVAVGCGAVAWRGYVVPYTPQFAPRLVAASPLPDDLFAKTGDAAERESLTATDVDGETVLRDLGAAGALEADGDMVRPAESIDVAWHREMDRLADASLDDLAATARATLPSVETVEAFTDGDSEWLAVGTGHGELVARPVAIAELAAYRALDDAVADERTRLAGARAFRMFLDSCPACETPLEASSEVSCCGGYGDPQTTPDEILVCPACRQRVYTFPSD